MRAATVTGQRALAVMLLWVLVGLWAAVAVLAVLREVNRAAFALPDERGEAVRALTSDGWTLSLWRRRPRVRRFVEPVVLCHGLANSGRFLDFTGQANLAAYLQGRGFEVYTVDLRGAGDSRPPELALDATVDDYVLRDAPAVVAATGARQVLWVGHSLGGIVGEAASGTSLRGRLKALVTVGSPVFLRVHGLRRWLLKLGVVVSLPGTVPTVGLECVAPLAWLPAPRLRRFSVNLDNLAPLRRVYLLVHVFAPLWHGVLAQLDWWSDSGRFASLDGALDYGQGMVEAAVPTLVVAGTGDPLAPPEVARRHAAAVPGARLALIGAEYGHGAPYGHGDLIVGDEAHRHVYPCIADFLEGQATPVDGATWPPSTPSA